MATSADLSVSLVEKLNGFFARFETSQQHSSASALPTFPASSSTIQDLPTPPPDFCTTLSTVQEHNVKRVLQAVNLKKAATPARMPGKVIRACAHQLALIFTRSFNLYLAQAVIQLGLKSTTIVSLSKKSCITSLNEHCPVALLQIIMKYFESLVLQHKSHLPPGFDPHQFAYPTNMPTEDVFATALHSALPPQAAVDLHPDALCGLQFSI